MERKSKTASYTIGLILKEQGSNMIYLLSQAIETFKNLYSEMSYILNKEKKDVDICFNCNNNKISFRVKYDIDDVAHSYIGRYLPLIPLYFDKDNEEQFKAQCYPSIRYALKKLFQILLELKVSCVKISAPNLEFELNEDKIKSFIGNKDAYKGCSKSVDILKGQYYLKKIFSEIEQAIIYAGTQDQFYENPQFIFRGITRFYPGDDSIEKKIDELKEQEKSDKLSLKNELPCVEKDLIKSSLSVRLRDTSKGLVHNDAYIRSHYVNALEETIRNAQNMYPTKYTADMSDLDVLADLQHNGGSTCLVDFSKNLLTSIWFACNTDREYNGYLYCYNIMEDMIKNDALTIIRPEDEKMKIAELLAQTYKETNVCSDVETRFCLWEPSKKNNRLFRQDSIFVFGIEKFEVAKHSIKVIGIKSEWKLPILTALKALFNISGSTVYNDYVGFANNTNKLRPYREMGESAYTRGYMNMIKGNYSSALAFFKLAEVDENIMLSWTDRKKLELHFSLGVCYKGLVRQEKKIRYYENALQEYQQVIYAAQGLAAKSVINKNYYMHKAIRAYNARITLLYKLARYKEAEVECEEIIKAIDNGWLKCYKNENAKLTSKYCKITILELKVLDLLSQRKGNKNIVKTPKRIDDVNLCLRCQHEKYRKQNTSIDFFKLLTEYYTYISIILKTNTSQKELNDEISKIIERWNCTVSFKLCPQTSDYILWNFADIKNAIDSINDDSCFISKKQVLQDLTAGVIALRDAFEMHGWWSKIP